MGQEILVWVAKGQIAQIVTGTDETGQRKRRSGTGEGLEDLAEGGLSAV